jgi:uncharacterized protein
MPATGASEDAMAGIRLATATFLCLLGAAATARAASFPCYGTGLSPVELAICQDPQLSRLDDDVARKARSLLPRLSYGQYLGLRYWRSRGGEARDQCGPDQACLIAQYRAQNRLLDGLRQCLDRGGGRRTCWRAIMLGTETGATSNDVALPR